MAFPICVGCSVSYSSWRVDDHERHVQIWGSCGYTPVLFGSRPCSSAGLRTVSPGMLPLQPTQKLKAILADPNIRRFLSIIQSALAVVCPIRVGVWMTTRDTCRSGAAVVTRQYSLGLDLVRQQVCERCLRLAQ